MYHLQTQNQAKNLAYNQAIKELKKEGNLDQHVSHLQIKYRNNRLEADHGKLKRLINPVRWFQLMKTAYVTIKGFEVMRMFKKEPFKALATLGKTLYLWRDEIARMWRFRKSNGMNCRQLVDSSN